MNGTEYESPTPIGDNVLTDDNLSQVVINGVDQGKMVLVSKYPYNGGTRFCIRQQTDEEKLIDTLKSENANLNQQLTDTQVALCDVYEMIAGLM